MKGWTRRVAMTSPVERADERGGHRSQSNGDKTASRGFRTAMRKTEGGHRGGEREDAADAEIDSRRQNHEVMASAMMPMSEICRRMSVRLPSCRKMREPSCGDGADDDGENK